MTAAQDKGQEPEQDREIELTRTFDAPRELVWKAWTSPEHVSNWWGPNGFTITTEVMHVRPGGVWNHTMHGPDGVDYPNKTVFIEVKPPELLKYSNSDGKSGPKGISFVSTVTFVEKDGKTTVTLRSLFPSSADRDRVVKEYGAIEGGKQHLARLAEYLPQIG